VAQKIKILLIDDLDGSAAEVPSGSGCTVPARYGSRREKGRRRGYPQLRSSWYLPLTRRLSCVFA